VIPDKAIDAALLAMRGLNFWDYTDTDYIRAMLEAAAPHMLEHFANRIDWRCQDCEEPVGPGKALKLLKEAGND